MTSLRARAALLPFLVAAALALASCASGTTPGGSPVPSEPVDVVGQGMVLQVGDAAPVFCLGAIAESYPPQCTGPELVDWNWDAVDGEETGGDSTFGMFAVTGSWDGVRLSVTSGITLALYDPMPFVDPALDPANAGESSNDDLVAIQDQIGYEAPVEVLTSSVENGYLFATVVFDDGSVQEWADATYGADVVQVRSALRVVEA